MNDKKSGARRYQTYRGHPCLYPTLSGWFWRLLFLLERIYHCLTKHKQLGLSKPIHRNSWYHLWTNSRCSALQCSTTLHLRIAFSYNSTYCFNVDRNLVCRIIKSLMIDAKAKQGSWVPSSLEMHSEQITYQEDCWDPSILLVLVFFTLLLFFSTPSLIVWLI